VWVHVVGQNFVLGDIIKVGGTAYTTTFTNSTKLCALVPAAVFATPTSLGVTVFRPPGGPSSNALTITVQWPVPTITDVNPSTVQQGSEDTPITITGTNYRSVSVVQLNGVTILSTFVDQQTLTATIPQIAMQTGGTEFITVINPTPGGGTSNPFTFLVGTNPPPPTPTLTSMAPSSASAGSGNLPITLTGTNFVNPTTFVFGGNNLSTVFGSITSLTATIPSTLLATGGNVPCFVTNANGTSNSLAFSIVTPPPPAPVPTLTGMAPSSVQAGSGNLPVTLTGTDFINPTTLIFGSSHLSTVFVNSTSLTATIPSTALVAAGSVTVSVSNANGSSNSITFTITSPPPPVPGLTSIVPSSVQAGGGNLPVTIGGTGFINPTTLVFGVNSIATTFVSSVSLTATISGALLASDGTVSVHVTNANGTSNSITFTITAAPPPILPSISTLTPSSTQAGSINTPLTVVGTNFINPTTIFFGATSLTTTFVDATTLTAIIPSTLLVSASLVTVTVQNTNGTSNGVTFTITAPPPPAPTLTTVSPQSVQAGTGNTTISLTGTGFINPSTAKFDATSLSTTFITSTSLSAVIPSTLLVSDGTASITVTNTSGVSNAVTFTITPAPPPPPPPVPTLTTVSPQSVQAGSGNTTINLTGTGFINPSTAKFGSTFLTTTFINSTSLSAVIPSSLLVNATTAQITVTNANGTSNGITFTVTSAPPPPPSFPAPQFQAPPSGVGLLAGMDAVNYPVGAVSVNANAPRWSEGNFRVADNGDAIVIFGDKFTADTTFLASGRNGAVLQGVFIGSVDVAHQMARLILPSGLPATDMYMVWPQNSIGVGEPFVVNRAEARWLNTTTAYPGSGIAGDICNVHGINLSNVAAAKCWVWLVPTFGGTPTCVDTTGTNLSVAPGRVRFTIPNLPVGIYQVWVHNGHGGQYGWSLCGDTLTITTAQAIGLDYSHNVQNLAAPAGGGLTDKAKFTSALTTIGNNGPGTLNLQAGTYLLDSQLLFVGGGGKAIKIKGQGVDVTFIKPTAGFTDNLLLDGFLYGQLEGVTVDVTGFAPSLGAIRSARIVNSKVIAPTVGAVDYTNNHPFGCVLNSTIISPQAVFTNGGPGGIVDGCTLRMTDIDFVAASIFIWNTARWSVTNCTCQDLVPA